MDANRKVYVYNADGGLLGLLDGRQLASTPRPRASPPTAPTSGSSTPGRTRCSGTPAPPAALSGSQNAAQQLQPSTAATPTPRTSSPTARTSGSSTTPRTDKVFKYTLAGSLVGQLDDRPRPTRSPTGITIDPANVEPHLDRRQRRPTASTSTTAPPAAPPAARRPPVVRPGSRQHQPQGIADPPPPELFAAMTSELRNVALIAQAVTQMGEILEGKISLWEVTASCAEPSRTQAPRTNIDIADLAIHRQERHQLPAHSRRSRSFAGRRQHASGQRVRLRAALAI